jgi:hypothetical protein
MRFEGVVGAPSGQLGDGVERAIRLGKLGELVVGGGARYAEAVRRGACFRAQTAVSGVAPGTVIGTAAALSLANPLGSGIDLAILEVSMGYISGTLGAGSVMLCGNRITTGAVPTGTVITAVNARIGDPRTATGQAKTTATLAVAPSVIGPFCSIGAHLASTAVAPWQIVRDINGGIVIAPGGVFSLQGVAAAGTSLGRGPCSVEGPKSRISA